MSVRVFCSCEQCNTFIEKVAQKPSEEEVAWAMVSYLARRHREKTGHTTTAIEKRDDRPN